MRHRSSRRQCRTGRRRQRAAIAVSGGFGPPQSLGNRSPPYCWLRLVVCVGRALADGRPVVLTTLAAAGINAHGDEHHLLADDAASTASAVVSLLRTPDRRTAIRQSARAFVQQRFNWEDDMGRLGSLLFAKAPTEFAPSVSVVPVSWPHGSNAAADTT